MRAAGPFRSSYANAAAIVLITVLLLLTLSLSLRVYLTCVCVCVFLCFRSGASRWHKFVAAHHTAQIRLVVFPRSVD